MAEVMRCKTSYVSLIFKNEAHPSLEQAHALGRFLSLSSEELNFFFLLVQKERAGTKELEEHFLSEIQKIQAEKARLKNQFKEFKTLINKEAEFRYFSTSDYSLCHVLSMIPSFQTKAALLDKLKVTPGRLEFILEALVSFGLVKEEKGRYSAGEMAMHLPDDSSIISTHHTNWRIQAMKNISSPKNDDLHYSSVITIDPQNFDQVRAMITDSLKKCRNVIRSAPSELPASLCIDFYKI